MNFSTHKNKIIESIETFLSKRKAGIVGNFKHILGKSSSLFKTNDFDFWLQQIERSRSWNLKLDYYGIEHLLSAYCGMGSFTDLRFGIFKVREQFKWKEGANELNEKLEALKSKSYELPNYIKNQHDTGDV